MNGLPRPWGIAGLRPPILPKGGTVRPGEKRVSEGGREYARELDYFNVEDAPALREYYGEQPRALRGMFASDEITEVIDLGYKRWHQNNTIGCRGDGRRAIDIDAGGVEVECSGEDCEHVQSKKCRRQIQISFLPIGDLEPITFLSMGIHTLTSGGWRTINNTLAWVNLMVTLYGRLAGIPWVMHREPYKIEREAADGKKINQVHQTIRFDIEKPLEIALPGSPGRPPAFDTCSEPSLYPQSMTRGAAALPESRVIEQAPAPVPELGPVEALLAQVEDETLRREIVTGFDIAGLPEEQQLGLLERYAGAPDKLQAYLSALVDQQLQGGRQAPPGRTAPPKRTPDLVQKPPARQPARTAQRGFGF